MRYDDNYDASDAAADAYDDYLEDAINEKLAPHVDPVMEEIHEMLLTQDEGEWIDNAHPYTWERELLAIYVDEGEDGLRELLDDHFREEAEEEAKDDYDSGPCCFQFSCPCGNSNNRPD